MSLRETMTKGLRERRQRILEGKVNSIPSPFLRFSNDFIGIEQSTYYTVTSFTKGGKSQFSSFVFIYNALLFAYTHRESVKVTILYFALEETPTRIMERFTSFLLYTHFNGKIRISPRDLRSSKNDNPVSEEILDAVESKEITDLLDFFEENVIFSTEANPTGIYKFCRQYAEEHGTVHYKTGKYKDSLGVVKERDDVFDYYEQTDPNEYVIPIIDTINLIDTERGMSLKQSMDKMSEYLAKYLRNRYHQSPLVIQQQAFDQEGNEAFKLNKVRPSVAGLGDSKYTSRDSNVVLGLFSPARFGLPEYMGYDISKLKDNIRFLEVIVNRDGEMGGIIALYFDGAVCHFEEMPKPEDEEAIKKIYKRIAVNKGEVGKSFIMKSVPNFFNKIKNIIKNE